MNISHRSDLEHFYSNCYVGLLLWSTKHSVFPFSSGGEAEWNPVKGAGQRNLIFFSGGAAYFEKRGLKNMYSFQILGEYILIWKIYLITIVNLKYTFLKSFFSIFHVAANSSVEYFNALVWISWYFFIYIVLISFISNDLKLLQDLNHI